jgi:carbohydrate esterase-like sialic acid-specific acetylesterase
MNVRIVTSMVVLLVASSALGAEKPADDVLPVSILAGQSNMAGGGRVKELPDDLKAPQKDALFVQFWGSKWAPLTPKKNFGPEIGFAREMTRELKRSIGIIKLASGGTSMAFHWNPVKTEPKKKGTGVMYKRLVGYVKRLQKTHKNIRIVGMLWMQGEADSRYYARAMESYRDNLETLIDNCRREFGNENMAFVCGRINPPNWPYQKQVRQAQETARRKNYAWIDCDDLTMHKDKLHYNTEGQLGLGKKFAEAMLKLMKQKGEKEE